jgi:hypothetical protein
MRGRPEKADFKGPSAMISRKRRSIVIHPKVQFRLLLHEWLHFTVIVFSLATGLFLPLVLRFHSSETGWMEQMSLGRTILFLHAHFWPVLLLVFLLLSIHSLIISSKIVGPIPRFLAAVQAFVEGKGWSSPVARRGDFLFDDMEALGRNLTVLQDNLHRVQREHEELQGLIERMIPALKRAPLPVSLEAELLRRCASVNRALRDLNQASGPQRPRRQNANEPIGVRPAVRSPSADGKDAH